jgi:hypothetical protein
MGRLQWLGREISPSLPAAPNFLHYFLRDPLAAYLNCPRLSAASEKVPEFQGVFSTRLINYQRRTFL